MPTTSKETKVPNVHHNISLSSEYKVHRPVKSVPERSLSKNSKNKAKLEKFSLILTILERHDILIYINSISKTHIESQ